MNIKESQKTRGISKFEEAISTFIEYPAFQDRVSHLSEDPVDNANYILHYIESIRRVPPILRIFLPKDKELDKLEKRCREYL